MVEQALAQLLLLLGTTVCVVLFFQRLQIPSSLAYLLVGVLLGSHTAGPVIQDDYIKIVAEFGIVFLLFTIGLSFSVANIYALRHTLFVPGTAQVVLTTAVIGILCWMLGFSGVTAFLIGAVFAQSSTTIISRQLAEQGESETRHGRLGTAMSVFQDITAVPFVIILPVLGVASASSLASDLGTALLKAALATGLVLLAGRYLMRPLFHRVTTYRSAELFTLTVLFVSMAAAWVTQSLGLSMAFGAFLAGMVLGETEFRHQVEATIRPFRDVLLGLFFISVGMLIQPARLPDIWLESLLGASVLLLSKIVLVALIVRAVGLDLQTAVRTALVLAVGGEFGFALLAVGLEGALIDENTAQIILTAVLFSMVMAPFLIRYNLTISEWLTPRSSVAPVKTVHMPDDTRLNDHVMLCGFGRTGQIVGHFLEQEKIPYIALDIDPGIVREASLAGKPVHYAHSTDPDVLDSLGLHQARLLIITHNDRTSALKTLSLIKRLRPTLPVVARARDESGADELRKAGALEVIPETLEAGITIASHALWSLDVPLRRINHYLREQRQHRYPILKELFRGGLDAIKIEDAETIERLHAVKMEEGYPLLNQPLGNVEWGPVMVNTLIRCDQKIRYPGTDVCLLPDDVLVLQGTPDELDRVEALLTGLPRP
ncbi:MAG: cation:proton antiporter [Gammaproteobacteria bacterium]|nr:cation:proton antiporter [Gammaproteobacteria bacterium]